MERADAHTEAVARCFDDWARRGRAEGMERGHGPVARQAFDRLLPLPADGRYLDVGCGNGYTVRWAAEHLPRGEAVGIDIAAGMIERAREHAATVELENVRFELARLPGAELPSASFDAVFTMECLYYEADIGAPLAAIRDLLKPGAPVACVVDYYAENPESHGWPDELGVPMTLLDAAGWRAAFEAAGLEVVDQQRLHPPLAAGQERTWKHEVGSLFTLGRRPPGS